MASKLLFPVQSDWARVATLCVALLVTASVHASPANCDGEMTEDQRFQAELCSAHAGCRFVFGIADTCTKVKSFLSKLGLGGRGSATKVTDDRVSYALAETGVPPFGISSCLFDFDRTKCKEYLSGGPKQPSAKDQADEIVKRLNSKVFNTTVWDAGLGLAKEGLLMCDDATNEAKMRDAVRAKERCALAEGNIRACLSAKEGHDKLRTKLQNLIANGGLGADAAGYRSLANIPYPECPTTLPSSGKTPKVALADYLKFWDTSEEKSEEAQSAEKENKANGVIARCDAKRRDISDALDNNELDRTSGLIDQFKAACSRENQTYADLTRLYKQRLAEARAVQETTALPRRGGSSGAEMFQQAINQAEQEEKNRPAREAGERAAKAAAVMAEARQTPEDRLRKNYDQRITAAREQCTASKESCDSGCTGVAVVGLLTMFASKGAGADEASAQIQQCSNRCDGAKSSCDEQVSSLEQEKSQAIADARNPPRPTASSSGIAQAPVGSLQGICVAAITEAMEADTRKTETTNQTLRKREDFRAQTPQPRSFFEGKVKEFHSVQCGQPIDLLLRQYPQNIASDIKQLNEERSQRAHEWQNMYITEKQNNLAMTKLAQCAAQARAAACGSTPASAQSGDSGVNRLLPAPAHGAAAVCEGEINQAVRAQQERINIGERSRITRSQYEDTRKGQFFRPCDAGLQRGIADSEAEISMYASNIEKNRTLYRDNTDLLRYSMNENAAHMAGAKVVLCTLRAKVAACGSSSP